MCNSVEIGKFKSNRKWSCQLGISLEHSCVLYIILDMERTFDVEPKNVTAYLGDVVVFSCKIGGIPRPSITWLKDDHELPTTSANYVIHEQEGILEIRSAQFKDFGRYRYVEDPVGDTGVLTGWVGVVTDR